MGRIRSRYRFAINLQIHQLQIPEDPLIHP
jgi:hypothetical protein